MRTSLLRAVLVVMAVVIVGLLASVFLKRNAASSASASAQTESTPLPDQGSGTVTAEEGVVEEPVAAASQTPVSEAAATTPAQEPVAMSAPEAMPATATAATADAATVAQASPPASAPAPAQAEPEEDADAPAPASRQRPQRSPGRPSVAAMLADADLTDPAERARVVAEMEAAEAKRYAAVLEKAEELGVPVRQEGPGNRVAILYDFRDDEPLYRVTMNQNAAISSAANLVYPAPYNLDGTGIKVGVWDAGNVRATHQEFGGRVTNRDSASLDDHATHVAGTVAAAGTAPTAKGMAPAVNVDAYDWNSDYAEMTAAGAAAGGDTSDLPISNHSYGYGAVTSDMGVYEEEARDTDAIARALPYYLIFWAAGNEQDELTAKNGYQSITFNGLAKNIMTIGAVNDAVSGGNRSLSSATMSYFSSWGPADDGRIKPDVVANGVSVYSPIDTSNTAYDSYSGTSMASPSSAGSAALLVELYKRELGGLLPRASTLKALLIHTADDLGNPGPDYQYGWGLINTKAAADVILAHSEFAAGSPRIIEDTITSGTPTHSYSFTWDGSSPIRATLSWTDPEGAAQSDNSRTPVLVNNLDLRITAPDGSTVYLPYVMPFVGNWSDGAMSANATTGDNNVDNVERIDIDAPSQAGVYTISVTLDGSLSGASQAFSLVVTGRADADQPPIFTPIADLLVVNGRAVSFDVFAADPADGDPITLSATNLPGGASFSATAGNGTFTWAAAQPNGTYTPHFFATDKDGTTELTVTITVLDNEPPELAPLTDQTVIISNEVSFAVAATDPVGEDPITLTADNLPAGASFSATNGDGLFIWSNPAPVGLYDVTFHAADVSGTNSATVYITVEPEPIYVYATNSAAITLNDNGPASPYPSTIQINGAEGVVKNVRVTLDGFSHTYPSDMDILLVGPGGQKGALMAGVGGGSPVTDVTLSFTDQAENMVGTPLTSGDWQPSGNLADLMPAPAPGLPYPTTLTNFNGTSPNGTWSLYAVDLFGEDSGAISRGWSLQLQVVILTNQPPVINVADPAPVPLGTDFEWTVTADDLTDNDFVSLSADSLPAGATFTTVSNLSTVTGTMFWTNVGPVGSYTATFRASDKDGTTTRTVPIEVFLPPPPAPDPIYASSTNNNAFTVSWGAALAADSYRLDVSTNANFINAGADVNLMTNPGFETGDDTAWTKFEAGYSVSTSDPYEGVYHVIADAGSNTRDMMQPVTIVGDGTTEYEVSFYYKQPLAGRARIWATWASGGQVSGDDLTPDTSYLPIAPDWTKVVYRVVPQAGNNVLNYEVRTYRDTVTLYDNFYVGPVGGGNPDSYLDGYSNLVVAATNAVVSGLTPAHTYYFRARAVNDGGASANSATGTVTTTFEPEAPQFTSLPGPYTNATGTELALEISATGLPEPGIVLDGTTATDGYLFDAGTLTYTPPLADVGNRTFTFIADNTAGAATQTVTVVVTEGPPPPPLAIWASETNTTDFTAMWTSVDGATGYQLDVSESASFGSTGSGGGTEPFESIGGGTTSSYLTRAWTNNGIAWTAFKARIDQPIENGDAICLRDEGGAYFFSSAISGGIDELSVVSQQKFSGSGGTFDILVNDLTVAADLPISETPTTHIVSDIGVTGDFVITITNSGAVRVSFDDLTWSSGPEGGEYVPGYSNLAVSGTSQLVTGLVENTPYYFRARAVAVGGVSEPSDVATVTTTMDASAPVFAANPGPLNATTGVPTDFLVSASGFPEPVLALAATTASGGYTFTPATGELSYTPPIADVGSRTFTFTAGNSEGVATQTVSVVVADEPAAPASLDISGYVLRQYDSTQAFTLPGGTEVDAGGYVLVARNAERAAFETFWGVTLGSNVVFLNSGGGFPQINGAETYRLEDDAAQLVDGTTAVALSANQTVQRVDVTLAATDAAAWSSSANSGATPGGGATGPGTAGLVVSEYADASGSGNFIYEFVELYYDAPEGAPGGDINGDGIPDSWFDGYGLSPTNTYDMEIPVGGATYLEAYVYDIDPTVALPDQFNRVQQPEPGADNTWQLTINPSSSARIYDVYWNEDLIGTNWVPFNLDVPGTGSPMILTITNEVPIRFYRTGAKLP
jgi:subtilisin-like proprotein convertase family protein